MKRALLTATVTVLALAGCVADDHDAAPTTNRSTNLDTTPLDTHPRRDPDSPPRTGGFGRSRLTFFSDCPDLLAYLRTETSARVTAWGLGGVPFFDGRPVPMMPVPVMEGVVVDAAATPGSDVGGPEGPATTAAPYSGTNTQEVGVDEGDMVETNGTHVFVAGQDGVRIIDVADARVVDELEVPEGSHQLLLDGDRLLVITQSWSGTDDTITSLYDVTDPSNPALLRRSHLEGRLVATRAVGGVARLVLTSTLANRLPFVYPQQFGLDEERALQENRRIIEQSAIDEWLPRWFDEDTDGSFGEMGASLDCASVAAPRDFSGLGVSWIASVDLHGDDSPVGSAGVVSSGDIVYASPSNIYLATVPWDGYDAVTGIQASGEQPPTAIHQFALGEGAAATYVASGEVPGNLLNQFAMSELDGDLRVATTVQPNWNEDGTSESAVYVLRPQGDELVTVGSVGGLGATEQIYAVRFLGSQAYVVTFRQTDPLYVIDLSDPTNPVVSGELKIPGYSAYLHPVGDGLLLGVGQDASVDGRTQGTKLSLFDVSDPANPREISSLPIGGSSEAEWDHHAFLFWPEDGTIVIPVSPSWQDCGPAIDCLAAPITSVGGAIVAQLQGTELVGRGVIQQDDRGQSTCWNPLQRSMIIGSEIVTIGLDQATFTDRATLATRDQVRWGDPGANGCVYWVES